MWTDAFAQAPAAAGSPDPRISMLLQFLQFVPIFLILYFLLIRPEQQRRKKADAMLKELKKGDRVLTTGGIYGVVVGLGEGTATIKIADETRVEFAKSAVVQVISAEAKP